MNEWMVAYKLRRYGAVLVLAKHYSEFCKYLNQRGVAYEAEYVKSMDAYLFSKKKVEVVA